MALPRLDDFMAKADPVISKTVMEPISYALDGSTFSDVDADVDYRDMLRAIDIAQVIEQDMLVQIFVADLAEKPASTHRIILPKISPLIKFMPINARRDQSGDLWEFELKRANG